MVNLTNITRSFMKATKGSVGGNPRIYNIDRDIEIYGYTAINKQATSAYSRIKVHKGWFTCSASDIQAGDLIQDRVDNNRYFVMAIKDEYNNGASVYLDGTLFFIDATATLSRFGGTARDSFGRPTQTSPVVIASSVPIMINPKNSESSQEPDTFIEQDSIQIYIQSKYAIQEADRLVTSHGDIYKVETINKSSLINIWICSVNKDSR